jgi:menaquinone-specific isochorismate synthase
VTTLVARTRRLDGDVDLLAVAGDDGAVFERGRVGLAGRGVALRTGFGEAAEALAAIEVDDEVGLPGCGPVAFGALPFDRAAWPRSELVVPATVWGRAEDGTRWVTTTTPAGTAARGDDDRSAPVEPPGSAAEPSRFAVEPTLAPGRWCELVAAATKAIAAGDFEKVVLAREVEVVADSPLSVTGILGRLRTAYPTCFVAHVEGFVAASPELLVSRSGDVVRSHPMAGTTARGGDPATDARLAAGLLASATYRHEHQITIDVVHDTLLGWCSYLDYEAEPSVVAVANVQHLATLVEGRLSRPAPSVLELVAALHPTPAVCGRPREAAASYIAAHEGFERRRYAGTYGWVDGAGNGQWAVGVRSAELDGTRARVYAGNGIVADSDPATELRETRAKLRAMLDAIVRP